MSEREIDVARSSGADLLAPVDGGRRVIHQVRRTLRHPAAPQLRQKPRPLLAWNHDLCWAASPST